MSQQLGIVVAIDVKGALEANTLENDIYIFDNMKLQGYEHEGTNHLVSAINGAHFFDGSQATEQVFNWLCLDVGAISATNLPRSYLHDQAKKNDEKILEAIAKLSGEIEEEAEDPTKRASVLNKIAKLQSIAKKAGIKTKVKSKHSGRRTNTGQKIVDITGEVVTDINKASSVSAMMPRITNVTGEAVDKKIIYPGVYGSPDVTTDGWYWAASVDTSRPGTYAYTMHIQLYKLSSVDGELTWVPVDMKHTAYLKVANNAKVNGFTQAGVGTLPVHFMHG